MKHLITTLILTLCLASAAANADVWRWTDTQGRTHYVNSLTPIYTWVDEAGVVWYSDTPEHANAVLVELVWHSIGDSVDEVMADANSEQKGGDTGAYDGETPDQQSEREQAEAYYCNRAQETHDTYLDAARLYHTSDSGDQEFISDEDSAQMLADIQARIDEMCN